MSIIIAILPLEEKNYMPSDSKLFARIAKNVVFVFDDDSAQQNQTRRTFKQMDRRVKLANETNFSAASSIAQRIGKLK